MKVKIKTKKRRRSKGKAKGSKFERDICYRLSEWWLGDDSDCVFWRTDASGGRATRRRKKGLKTTSKCGDISSTHPCSAAFTKLITPELKVGYPRVSVADLFDRPRKLNNKTNQTVFEEFLAQAEEASANAQTPYWILIHRRTQRETMVYFPHFLYTLLEKQKMYSEVPCPMIQIKAKIQLKQSRQIWKIVGMRFDSFLSHFTPEDVKKAWKQIKKAPT